jgi:hypothetical protein
MDLAALREAEDRGARAVRDLPVTAKWAALEVLIAELHLRITQVDIPAEKVKAFKKENDQRWIKENVP